jgi:DNA-binding NarL/FixJ family response regulator
MKSSAIRIVIIEGDYILRNEYERLIHNVEDYKVINSYNSINDATENLKSDDPDVILLDTELPGINGIEALPAIKKVIPRSQIIMLAVYEFEEQIFRALTNGASGYLTKNTPISKIIKSIRYVQDGGVPMSPSVARIVLKSFWKNDNSPLSKRETQILQMIGVAKNRKEIASELFIDTETVKWHLKNIYTKLHVSSKSDAIKEARRYKLI